MSTEDVIGKWSECGKVPENVKEMCEKLKPEAEEKEHMKFPEFIPLNYRRLVLCGGTHYEVKVYVGNDLCLFLEFCQVFVGLPLTDPELKSTVLLPLPRIIRHQTL